MSVATTAARCCLRHVPLTICLCNLGDVVLSRLEHNLSKWLVEGQKTNLIFAANMLVMLSLMACTSSFSCSAALSCSALLLMVFRHVCVSCVSAAVSWLCEQHASHWCTVRFWTSLEKKHIGIGVAEFPAMDMLHVHVPQIL